jgi:hypothetical protein
MRREKWRNDLLAAIISDRHILFTSVQFTVQVYISSHPRGASEISLYYRHYQQPEKKNLPIGLTPVITYPGFRFRFRLKSNTLACACDVTIFHGLKKIYICTSTLSCYIAPARLSFLSYYILLLDNTCIVQYIPKVRDWSRQMKYLRKHLAWPWASPV